MTYLIKFHNPWATAVAFPYYSNKGRYAMAGSVYKIIELVGTSKESWEDAARNAVETAAKSLKDLRIAEIVKLDMQMDNDKVVAYRARVNVSFKYLQKEK
jgi:hypothetical protein